MCMLCSVYRNNESLFQSQWLVPGMAAAKSALPAPGDSPALPQNLTVQAPTSSYTSVLQQFYLAYFGRPADTTGLASGAAALSAALAPNSSTQALLDAYGTNATVRALVDGFGTSAESLALYAGATVRDQVLAVYRNVLNREGETGGVNYWTGEVTSGRLRVSQVALAVIAAAQSTPDAGIVSAKIAVANAFTTALDLPVEAESYSGDAAAATVRNLLRTVTPTDTAGSFDGRVSSTITQLVAADVVATVAAAAVIEGNAGTTNLVFTVALNRAASSTVAVNFSTEAGGTATAGADFSNVNQVVTFAPGQRSATVNVQVLGDTLIETNETISVRLAAASTGVQANATAVGTIVDNDQPVTGLGLALSRSVVNNGAGPIANLSTQHVAALDSGSHWVGRTSLTFSFNETLPADYIDTPQLTNNWQAFNAAERQATRAVIADYNRFGGLQITEVSGEGDIRFNSVNAAQGQNGFAVLPINQPRGGDVFLAGATRFEVNAYTTGSVRATLAHELGHALGLKHPFEGAIQLPQVLQTNEHTLLGLPALSGALPVFTRASNGSLTFSAVGGSDSTFKLLDVHAIQALYGRANVALTDNTYRINAAVAEYLTIADSGGVDTIDAGSALGFSTVDLRPGNLSSIGVQSQQMRVDTHTAELVRQGATDAFARPFVTSVISGQPILYNGQNNLGIPFGVIIENVITANGDDTVFDNLVNNIIRTGAGNDRIHLGAGGFDFVDGGSGVDTLVLGVPNATVQRTSEAGLNYLVGENFSVQLLGVEQIQFSDGTVQI